jgi:cation/acetate symporter
MIDVFAVTMALMVGTAGLPHVITRFYTVPTVRAARYSAGWALLFIALLYTTAPAIAAFARYNLIDTLQNATVASVTPGEKQDIYELTYPDGTPVTWATSWQKTGLLAFVDKNGDGKIELRPGAAFEGRNFKAPTDSANEVFFDNDIIVLANPEIAQLAPIIIALVAAGGWRRRSRRLPACCWRCRAPRRTTSTTASCAPTPPNDSACLQAAA